MGQGSFRLPECQEEEEEGDSAEEKCIFKKRTDEGTMAQNVTQDVVQILPQRKQANFRKARELTQVFLTKNNTRKWRQSSWQGRPPAPGSPRKPPESLTTIS